MESQKMIPRYVNHWISNKSQFRKRFAEEHPKNYEELVKAVIQILATIGGDDALDHERIHKIDWGEYTGVQLYIIANRHHWPTGFFYVCVEYGSDSVCDTLQRILDYGDHTEPPTKKQLSQYESLALHIVQALKYSGDLCFVNGFKD